MIRLEDYITKFFGGSQVKFARHVGKTPQHINRQIGQGTFYVASGHVVQLKYAVT